MRAAFMACAVALTFGTAVAEAPPAAKARSLADDLKALDGQWELRKKEGDADRAVERLFRLTLKDGKGLLTIVTAASAKGAAGASVRDHKFDYTLGREDSFSHLQREKAFDASSKVKEPTQPEGKPRTRFFLANHTVVPAWDGTLSVVKLVLDGDKLTLKGPLKVSSLKSEHIDMTGDWARPRK
jgi:hypothetical protein